MSKKLVLLGCIVSCILIFNAGKIFAEDQEPQAKKTADWKQELASDRQAIKEQRGQMKENAQASRAEEKQLRDQIKAAMDSGDMEKAHQLRQQLRATHRENVQQMIQDKKEMKIDRRDFKKDIRGARHEGNLPPRRDRDNNPPGPRGGPGTNWENPPGPRGGPGVSPDRKPWRDRGNNPPGPRGGPGTNWGNPPGPKGGPGVSPDKKPWRDRDNNPPGPKGGPGTNWENKPGPRGGPGASPNRAPKMNQGGPKSGAGAYRR